MPVTSKSSSGQAVTAFVDIGAVLCGGCVSWAVPGAPVCFVLPACVVCVWGCLALMQMLTCVPCCPTYDTYVLCLILAMQGSRKTRPFPGSALSVRTHQGPALGGCHLQGMSSAPQPSHPPTCPWTKTAREGPDVSLQSHLCFLYLIRPPGSSIQTGTHIQPHSSLLAQPLPQAEGH